jgi:hypothetical protein
MENETQTIETQTVGTKKCCKGWVLVIIVIVVAIVAVLAIVKTKKDQVALPTNESEEGLNTATQKDTTASMDASLDSINLEDTSSEDLKAIDQELENL